MTDQKLVDAVKEVRQAAMQAVIVDRTEAALKANTNEALTRALIHAREVGMNVGVIDAANRALGFPEMKAI